MCELSDDELMRGVQQGQFDLLEALVRRYQGPLFGYATRILQNRAAAEDAVQESFLKLFRSRAQYRGQSGFRAWIYRICLNVCRDQLRRNQRAVLEPLDGLELADGASGPEQQTVVATRVREAVARLPDKQREVFLLVHHQDLSYAEVAGVLDIPLGTVKTRMFHAVRKLSELLGDLSP